MILYRVACKGTLIKVLIAHRTAKHRTIIEHGALFSRRGAERPPTSHYAASYDCRWTSQRGGTMA